MNHKMKILIAYDGSACAVDAIEDLKFAGLNTQVEALAFSVSDVWETEAVAERVYSGRESMFHPHPESIKPHLAGVKKQTQILADDAALRVSEIFPEWKVEGEACLGKPAWEIIEKADDWQADLIVVGSQGRSALGRALLGSVSQKVLHEARCSVRIAIKRADEQNPVRILIAFDGSDFAKEAVQTVARRQWAEGTEFRIIIADDDVFSRPEVSLIDYLPEGKKDSPEALSWIRKTVETPLEILESAGLKATYAIRWGDARNIILNEAESWKADSIFMGSRGMGRFRRFLLGSVAASVAAKAKCSVEVVRSKKEKGKL